MSLGKLESTEGLKAREMQGRSDRTEAKLRRAFTQALGDLDLERVQATMKLLEWRWASIGDTPNAAQMVQTIMSTFEDTMARMFRDKVTKSTTMTGGFRVEVERGDDAGVRISFEITEGEAGLDEER